MDGVLLIGVSDSVERALRSRLCNDVSVTNISALPNEDSALPGLAEAVVAVVGEASWSSWSGRIPVKVRPPTYVLVESNILSISKQEEYFRGGAVGCSPVGNVEWLLDAITRRADLARGRSEAPAFRVGELVSVSGADVAALVGWGAGPSGEVFSAVKALEARLWPLLDDGVSPFVDVSAAEWLELYAYLRLGLKELLGDAQADALKKKVKDKLKKTADDFCQLFEKTLINAGPVTRPQAILVLGETGTGKSLIVKRLHRALKERTGASKLPLHHVNCSTLGEMADAELFGAMRGAYTPLHYTNPGAILTSFGGTIFLDEFATLSPKAQARLLLFLEDGTVKPMSWPGPALRVPVLVIAATNEHLEHLVAQGTFRSDLFHRFRDGRIELPPLRETKDRDLPYLVDYHLQTDPSNTIETPARSKVSPGGCENAEIRRVDSVSMGALDVLLDHDYPGNFRELQMALAQAVDRAVARRSTMLTRADVAFGDSTLQRQDSVVAIITRTGPQGLEVLLRSNPYWRNWFLPGGRVIAGEGFEACLERELKEKLGLSVQNVPPDYSYEPLTGQPEIKLIQYSSRDRKYKHYYFYAYRVTTVKEVDTSGARRSVKWCAVSELRSTQEMNSGLSPTLSRFRTMWDSLVVEPAVASLSSGIQTL